MCSTQAPSLAPSSGSHLQVPWEELKCQQLPALPLATRQSLGTVPHVKRPQGQAQHWEFYFLGKSRILRHMVSKSQMGVGS